MPGLCGATVGFGLIGSLEGAICSNATLVTIGVSVGVGVGVGVGGGGGVKA